MYLLKINKFKL